jgi:hypothetical protein
MITKGTIHAFDLNKESEITKAAVNSRINSLKKVFENH